MEGNKIRIKVSDTDSLGDIVEYLKAKAITSEKGSSSITASRIAATKIFRTVYGYRWQNVEAKNINAEDLFKMFKQKTVSNKYSDYTLNTYYKRLLRAFSLYNMKDKEIKSMQIATKDFEIQVKKMMESIEAAKKIFLEAATNYLFTDEARDNYNIYAIPIDKMKPVALALPKEMSKSSVNTIKSLLERACSRITIEKEGGCDVQKKQSSIK